MKIQVEHLENKNLTANEVVNFKMNPYNRSVLDSALKKTIKTIYDPETHSWCQVSPIQVNVVTGNIIDGQHRWNGFLIKVKDGGIPQDSTIPVHFVKIPHTYKPSTVASLGLRKIISSHRLQKAMRIQENFLPSVRNTNFATP